MSDLHKMGLDTPVITPIVKETPLAGDDNTYQGLTSQAEGDSMEAAENPISRTSSRQLLSPAVDEFSFKRVEYCAPPDDVVQDFIWAVCERLAEGEQGGRDCTEIRQGFMQFFQVVINIMVKHANQGVPCEENICIQSEG